jgi:hypothetical protein
VKVDVSESRFDVDEVGVAVMMFVDAEALEDITNDGKESDVVAPAVNKTADDDLTKSYISKTVLSLPHQC